jgi:oligopeptide transport system ATP-binding protein
MENSAANTLLSGHKLSKAYVIERQPVIGKPKRLFLALNNVTFYIREGETVGIVGESGSGKSTLGEILGGLQAASQGAVYFRSKDIRTLDKNEYQQYRKNVQFIFQDPKNSLHPYFKVRELIGEPLLALNICQDRRIITGEVTRMMSSVKLEEEYADKYPTELSGGQCQRVAIARALIVNPQVVVCDEVVSALDVSVQAQILNLLKDMQRQYNTAYIFISHDIGVVNYMSDRIVVMSRGNIVETGTADQVLKSPVDPYTQNLVMSSFYKR